MVNWFVGVLLGIYLVGALGFGLARYADSTDKDLLDALQHGFAWPGALVNMARSPTV
jgi:hypothetical protein